MGCRQEGNGGIPSRLQPIKGDGPKAQALWAVKAAASQLYDAMVLVKLTVIMK